MPGGHKSVRARAPQAIVGDGNEPVSLVQNFHVWNVWGDAVYDYVGAYITFDGFVALYSFSELAQGTNGRN
jgi:hypothetical protein